MVRGGFFVGSAMSKAVKAKGDHRTLAFHTFDFDTFTNVSIAKDAHRGSDKGINIIQTLKKLHCEGTQFV